MVLIINPKDESPIIIDNESYYSEELVNRLPLSLRI